MLIQQVETFLLSHPLDQAFYFSQHRYDTRSVCLVRITLDNGLTGWGEGYGPARIVQSGIAFLAPLVMGQSPLEQENLWQSMYLRSRDHARSGILLSSLSALDIALWDLKGKILRQPVSVLLGGRRRRSVRAYATGLYFSKAEDLTSKLASEAEQYRRQGFSAVKMKVGLGVERDLENLRAARQALGARVELMMDANHAFSWREALRLAEAAEELGITWFEEPLSPDDYRGYRELRERSPIAIAAGECEYLRQGFLRLFEGRCVDIAQPDPCAAGGISETKKIADLAYSCGADFIPHCWGSCVAVATSLHLLSNADLPPGRLLAREPILELDRTENPFREELGSPPFQLEEGRISVPEGPGLGIEIDEGLLDEYCVDTFST